jgi:hypothetical protein
MTPEEKKNTNWEKCMRSLSTFSTPEYRVPSPESPTVSDEDIPRRPGSQITPLNSTNSDRHRQDSGRQSLESNVMEEGAAESIVVTPTSNARFSHSNFAKRTAAGIGDEDSHARKRPKAQTPPGKPLTQVINSTAAPVILPSRPSGVSQSCNRNEAANSTNGAATRTGTSCAAQRSGTPSGNSTSMPGISSVATSAPGLTKSSTGRGTAACIAETTITDSKQAQNTCVGRVENPTNNWKKSSSTAIPETSRCNTKPLEQPGIAETTKVTPTVPQILGKPITSSQDQTNSQQAQDSINTPVRALRLYTSQGM